MTMVAGLSDGETSVREERLCPYALCAGLAWLRVVLCGGMRLLPEYTSTRPRLGPRRIQANRTGAAAQLARHPEEQAAIVGLCGHTAFSNLCARALSLE